MSNPWDTLVERYNAEPVGGQLIALVDGKHTTLGYISNGQLVLTPEGQRLNEVAPLDHDGNGKRGGGRPKKTVDVADPEPAPEPEPEPEVETVKFTSTPPKPGLEIKE